MVRIQAALTATPLRDCDVTWSFTNGHHDRRAASRAANSCTTNRDCLGLAVHDLVGVPGSAQVAMSCSPMNHSKQRSGRDWRSGRPARHESWDWWDASYFVTGGSSVRRAVAPSSQERYRSGTASVRPRRGARHHLPSLRGARARRRNLCHLRFHLSSLLVGLRRGAAIPAVHLPRVKVRERSTAETAHAPSVSADGSSVRRTGDISIPGVS